MNDFIHTVDVGGNRTGVIDKMEAHKRGVLHEAFSIFVFNSKGEMLLQKRNPAKYHSGGLWSNTCCSHAQEGEKIEDAIHRRLKEEMGFDCDFTFLFSFHYTAKLPNKLIENEFDYVYVGHDDNVPAPDPEEVAEYKWMNPNDLLTDIKANPSSYTAWLSIIAEHPAFLDFIHTV